jgi:tRNA-specific 2-thiouridylase
LARVTLGPNEGRAEAVFLEPQPAVTPGQAAALYDGDVLMGGGWIEAALGA